MSFFANSGRNFGQLVHEHALDDLDDLVQLLQAQQANLEKRLARLEDSLKINESSATSTTESGSTSATLKESESQQ